MLHEAAQEFFAGERHGALFVVVGVVFPAEEHLGWVDRENSVVGNGHAVRVTGQIVQHVFGPAEWWLGIDDPVGPSELIEPLGERAGIGEMGEIAKEAKLASREGGL